MGGTTEGGTESENRLELVGAPQTHYWQRRNFSSKSNCLGSGRSDNSICWGQFFFVVVFVYALSLILFCCPVEVVDPSLLGRVASGPV
jgi:hypothetical protein